MHPFRAAIEARDAEAAAAVLADGVVFRSPIVYKPYAGRSAAAAVVGAALRVFEDFAYDQLTVMVRPLSAALALRERMAAQLEAHSK